MKSSAASKIIATLTLIKNSNARRPKLFFDEPDFFRVDVLGFAVDMGVFFFTRDFLNY